MSGAPYMPSEANPPALRDKVVVLTGGANGIGRALVQQLAGHGAFVVFGDVDAAAGQSLAASIPDGRATGVRCDVTRYADVVALFKAARARHGRVDHAVAVAGIMELGSWFGADLTVESVDQPETERVFDVNLLGTLYFARVAVAYLKDGRQAGDDRSLTLVSSAAAFREAPGLPVYQCTKHAVLGLLRTLRPILPARDKIRVNCVLPAMTDTTMVSDYLIDAFRAAGRAINTADDVARFLVDLAASPDRNGLAVYVEGAKGWELEEGLKRTMPEWLGEEPAKNARADESIVMAQEWS